MKPFRWDIEIASGKRTLVSIREFTVRENRMTFLFGESGIGKSLISKAVYGLLNPDDLDVRINREPFNAYLADPDTQTLQRNSFFVFQEPSSHLHPLLTLDIQLREGSLSKATTQEQVLEQLWDNSTRQDIRHLLDVYPKPFRPSGGEKQRVLAAAAFMKIDMLPPLSPDTPTLFVFDEPTGSLDNHLRDVLLDMTFDRFRQRRFTILIITHDYSMISKVRESAVDLRDSIDFKELALHRGSLALNDFQPDTYTTWVTQDIARQGATARQNARDPVCEVPSGTLVFGRRLLTSRDHAGKTEAPLRLAQGSMVYLKAPSGTGKTTLVKIMMGLQRADSFSMTLGNIALSHRTPRRLWQRNIWGRRMTMVFQHADEALNLQSTVREIFLGLPSVARITDYAIRETLAELFDPEDIGGLLGQPVGTLSGGQKQKLNLLRGLFLHTDVLILDEPLNGLDFESARKVIAMLRKKQLEGKALLVISHNEEIFDAVTGAEATYFLHSIPFRIGSHEAAPVS